MPTVSVDTLREVINRSQVLTAPEKQEWFRLVEFMNDKQLLDLYHILVPQGVTPSLDQSDTQEVSSVVPKQDAVQDVHKEEGGVAAAPRTESNIGEGTPLSSFLQRARGGSTQTIPETASEASVQITPTVFAPPRNDFDISPKNKDVQPQNIAETTSIEPPVEHIEQQEEQQQEPHPEIIEPIVEESAPASPPMVDSTTDNEPVMEEEPAMTSLTTVSDVANCNVGTLRTLGVDGLSEKLLTIIKHTGYFDTLFALEQSALFSAYVRTGMKLIELQMAFEDFQAQHSGGGVYLTREEFEGFADMLGKLGSG